MYIGKRVPIWKALKKKKKKTSQACFVTETITLR